MGEDQDRDTARVRVIKDGPVGEIRLNQPEVLNAQGLAPPRTIPRSEGKAVRVLDERTGAG